MKGAAKFQILIFQLIVALMLLGMPVYSQNNSTCTNQMIQSFTPCISYITDGNNISSPSSECCGSLRDLTGSGLDCLCLIVMGGVSFHVPINRVSAISLPRACRVAGVPIRCNGTVPPVPPPAGPSGSPGSTSPSPAASRVPNQPGDQTPSSDPVDNGSSSVPEFRPDLLPSAAQPAQSISRFLLAAGAAIAMRYY